MLLLSDIVHLALGALRENQATHVVLPFYPRPDVDDQTWNGADDETGKQHTKQYVGDAPNPRRTDSVMWFEAVVWHLRREAYGFREVYLAQPAGPRHKHSVYTELVARRHGDYLRWLHDNPAQASGMPRIHWCPNHSAPAVAQRLTQTLSHAAHRVGLVVTMHTNTLHRARLEPHLCAASTLRLFQGDINPASYGGTQGDPDRKGLPPAYVRKGLPYSKYPCRHYQPSVLDDVGYSLRVKLPFPHVKNSDWTPSSDDPQPF